MVLYIYLIFSYRLKMGVTVQKFLGERKQIYHPSQIMISIVYQPQKGLKIPMFVHFPELSDARITQNNGIQGIMHVNPGTLRGLFYLPSQSILGTHTAVNTFYSNPKDQQYPFQPYRHRSEPIPPQLVQGQQFRYTGAAGVLASLDWTVVSDVLRIVDESFVWEGDHYVKSADATLLFQNVVVGQAWNNLHALVAALRTSSKLYFKCIRSTHYLRIIS